MVSPALLQELDTILKEEYSVEFSDAELTEVGNSLVRYFELLASIDHKIKQENKNESGLPQAGADRQ